MDHETSNHPGPASDRVNVTGADLTPEQLDALTDEQRTRLTSGEPLPVDPRSPLADNPVDPDDAEAVADALDRVEGTGDGDGDGLMDHGAATGEDVREESAGSEDDGEPESGAEPSDAESSDTPLAAGLTEPAPWGDASDR